LKNFEILKMQKRLRTYQKHVLDDHLSVPLPPRSCW